MQDPNSENYKRGERAYRALLAGYPYAKGRMLCASTIEEAVIDLLTDLRHMLVDYSGDLDELCKVSKEHFEVESACTSTTEN